MYPTSGALADGRRQGRNRGRAARRRHRRGRAPHRPVRPRRHLPRPPAPARPAPPRPPPAAPPAAAPAGAGGGGLSAATKASRSSSVDQRRIRILTGLPDSFTFADAAVRLTSPVCCACVGGCQTTRQPTGRRRILFTARSPTPPRIAMPRLGFPVLGSAWPQALLIRVVPLTLLNHSTRRSSSSSVRTAPRSLMSTVTTRHRSALNLASFTWSTAWHDVHALARRASASESVKNVVISGGTYARGNFVESGPNLATTQSRTRLPVAVRNRNGQAFMLGLDECVPSGPVQGIVRIVVDTVA